MRIDGSIRSWGLRLSRIVIRGSLILLGVTLVYWAIAFRFGNDFRSLDGSNVKFPTLAVGSSHREVAAFLDQRGFLFWHVTDPAGGTLPLAKPHGLIGGLFQQVNCDVQTDRSDTQLYIAHLVSFYGRSKSTGSPVTISIVYAPIWHMASLFALYPLLLAPAFAWRRGRAWLTARRVWAVRRRRNALGRCTCGYDLRGSRARCPECGRPFRLVPVTLPTVA